MPPVDQVPRPPGKRHRLPRQVLRPSRTHEPHQLRPRPPPPCHLPINALRGVRADREPDLRLRGAPLVRELEDVPGCRRGRPQGGPHCPGPVRGRGSLPRPTAQGIRHPPRLHVRQRRGAGPPRGRQGGPHPFQAPRPQNGTGQCSRRGGGVRPDRHRRGLGPVLQSQVAEVQRGRLPQRAEPRLVGDARVRSARERRKRRIRDVASRRAQQQRQRGGGGAGSDAGAGADDVPLPEQHQQPARDADFKEKMRRGGGRVGGVGGAGARPTGVNCGEEPPADGCRRWPGVVWWEVFPCTYLFFSFERAQSFTDSNHPVPN